MKSKLSALTLAIAAFTVLTAQARDFGVMREKLLLEQVPMLFGVEAPLEKSAAPTTGAYRRAQQPAAAQVLVAEGLRVEYLTRSAADRTDMMVLWPDDKRATHLITCVEGRRQEIGTVVDDAPRLNPSVQRIRLTDGNVETVLRGMSGCDGIRRTPWGTVLVTEERADGGAYEILTPLSVTEQTVLNRATGSVTDPAHIAKRPALPTMAWEGLTILPGGVVIAGDELRPGTAASDANGGAIYKFVPQKPRTAGKVLDALADSPLVSGSVYALQVSCRDSRQQIGQGCEVGNAAWVPVRAATARGDADGAGATGYYRPEDLHRDPFFHDPAFPGAVRFCWSNTGNEQAGHYGEVMCAVDRAPDSADADRRTVVVNRFIEGDSDFNSLDNLAFQPVTGNLHVIEDHPNGDIFACLRDDGDRDIKSDGCIKILSVRDTSAEPTGFVFSGDGRSAYLSIQHSNDRHMPLVDGYGTDDVLKISGFRFSQ